MFKVSVIITTYQSSASILRTLDSIAAQEHLGKLFTLEVIVVDDCSSDDTVSIVKGHALSPKVLSTRSNSGGPNMGRNIGLSHATGDYLCIMDHDDVWSEVKVSRQLSQIGNASIAFTNMRRSFDGKTPVIADRSCNMTVETYEQNAVFRDVLRHGSRHFFYNTMMFSKALQHHRFEEIHGMVDYDWFLRILRDQPVVRICTPLVTRFIDRNNLSRSAAYRRIAHQFGKDTLFHYQADFPNEVQSGLKRLNGSLARYHYLMGNMPEAREYLTKSAFTLKNVLYYITTFGGSRFIRKHIDVF